VFSFLQVLSLTLILHSILFSNTLLYILLLICVFSMEFVRAIGSNGISSEHRLISCTIVILRKICVLICIGRSDVEQRIDSHCLSLRRLVTLSKQQHVCLYASARHTCCRLLCFAQDLPVASRRVSAGGVPTLVWLHFPSPIRTNATSIVDSKSVIIMLDLQVLTAVTGMWLHAVWHFTNVLPASTESKSKTS
jgi:hypothetical protein